MKEKLNIIISPLGLAKYMSSCWEIISLKRNKVSQMVFDNMSQELCVHHTMCVCTDTEILVYAYLHSGCVAGVSIFFFFLVLLDE